MYVYTNVYYSSELRSEIERLKSLSGDGTSSSGGLESLDQSAIAEVLQLKQELLDREKVIAEHARTWEEKLMQAERRKQEELEQLKVL